MMMNRTKSAVVDALLKLRFKGLEPGPPLASSIQFHRNPFLSTVVDDSIFIEFKKNIAKLDKDLEMLEKIARKDFVDDFTHLLKVGTKHDDDDFSKRNHVTCITTLMHGLIFEDRINEAYMLFKKSIENQLCEPDTFMYNTLIKALCSKPDKIMMDDALKLFQEMVSQPDVVTYNSLVSGLCKMRRWTKATLLLKEMLDQEIYPDVETFNVLVNTFCIEGRLEVARHVIYMMHERGICPSTATYNSLIDGHCLKGEMDEAHLLFNLMVSSHLAPDTATYTILLNGYCNDDKMDDAMLIYHEMNDKGFKPNCVTYNLMIQSCFSAARFGDAHKLLDDMLAQGQTLDSRTYCDILRYLFRKHLLEEAFSLFHLLGDYSKPNSDNYVVGELMNGAINCGKLDFARELFEGLSVKGIASNVHLYTTMIIGFCEEGLVNDAKRLFLEMEENQYCQPNNDTYNFLLQGYLKNKCYGDVKMLLHKMVERRRYLYESTLSMLRASVKAGSLDSSLFMFPDRL